MSGSGTEEVTFNELSETLTGSLTQNHWRKRGSLRINNDLDGLNNIAFNSK